MGRRVTRVFKKDDGQVSLAVVLLALVVLIVGIGLMVIGQASDARGKAQKAADAAALAAVDAANQPWVDTWARMQTPPEDPEDGEDTTYSPPQPPFQETMGSVGLSAAESYAAANSNSTVHGHDFFEYNGGLRFRVDTQSEATEEVGTVNALVDSPQGGATATAETNLRGPLVCRQDGDWPDGSDEADDDDDGGDEADPELESWTLTCWVAAAGSGTSATIEYHSDTSADFSYDSSAVGQWFDVRLVD